MDGPANAIAGTVEWKTKSGLVAYPCAVAAMEQRVQAILDGSAPEWVWLLEHPPLYTAGTSAHSRDLLVTDLPVFQSGRGGQYTYHGPGQRIAYVMVDLNRRGRDVRCHVHNLEEWGIRALRRFEVDAERHEGRVGLWIDLSRHGRQGEAKIGAIGVRVRRWVTFHGLSLNVSPDLSHYSGIVPCGIREHGVTSLADLGIGATMDEVDTALKESWTEVFG